MSALTSTGRGVQAAVNAKLTSWGYDCQLRKGDGYCYFSGASVEHNFSTSTCVHRVNSLSVHEWLTLALGYIKITVESRQ